MPKCFKQASPSEPLMFWLFCHVCSVPKRLDCKALPGLAQTVDICSEGPLEVLEKCGATDATESSGQPTSSAVPPGLGCDPSIPLLLQMVRDLVVNLEFGAELCPEASAWSTVQEFHRFRKYSYLLSEKVEGQGGKLSLSCCTSQLRGIGSAL